MRELEGALIRLVAHSSLIGAEITLPYAQQVLKNFIDSQARKVTIESVSYTHLDVYKRQLEASS